MLEEDLVSSCRGTWSQVKKGGYYGISIVYSSGGSLTLYPGGEGAECLVMPVNPANPLEAVTFEKTFCPGLCAGGKKEGRRVSRLPQHVFPAPFRLGRACGPAGFI